MMDKSRYKIIIRGIAQKTKVANKIAEIVKNVNRISFPFQPKFLNFNANKGSSITSIMDMKIVVIASNQKFNTKCSINQSFAIFSWIDGVKSINGSATKNKVLAGVGKPIKESDCRISKLNLARRNNDNIGIIKAM